MFGLDRNIDGAARDVQAAINAAASELPVNLPNPPTYRKYNPADSPIMVLSMYSDTLPPRRSTNTPTRSWAKKSARSTESAWSASMGLKNPPSACKSTRPALASARLSLEDVRSFLGQATVVQPIGGIDGNQLSYTFASNDQLVDAREYRSLILTQADNTPIRLTSIGKTIEGVENGLLEGGTGPVGRYC